MFLRACNSVLAGHVGGVARREIRAQDGVHLEMHYTSGECRGSLCPLPSSPSPHLFPSGCSFSLSRAGCLVPSVFAVWHPQSRPAGCWVARAW